MKQALFFIAIAALPFILSQNSFAQAKDFVQLQGALKQTDTLPSTWVQQNAGTSTSIGSIFFVTPDSGWATSAAAPLFTSDGGNHWIIKQVQGTSFTTSSYGDMKNVWMVEDLSNRILHTTDGWQTWERDATPISNPGISAISFITKDTGFVTGEGEISRTIDMGKTWDYQRLTIASRIHACSFLNSKIGVFVGDAFYWPDPHRQRSVVICRTTDGGSTWVRYDDTARVDLFGVCKNSPSTLVAAGSEDGVAVIMRSTDYGVTWHKTTILEPQCQLYAVSFADSLNGLAVGSHGLVFHTTDGGISWIVSSSLTPVRLLSVWMMNDSVATIGGENGLIFHTSNSGQSWVSSNNGLSELYITSYPNPTNSTLNFEYKLPLNQKVWLELYDDLGRKIGSYLSGDQQSSGLHKLSVSSSILPAGVYHYRLITNRSMIDGKVAIVR